MTAMTNRRQSTKKEGINIRTTVERKAFYERAADLRTPWTMRPWR